MDKTDLKNIIVLKNLPSNIIDEAIIILKHNKKIKRLEVIDKKNTNTFNKEQKNNFHIIKEAQLLINSYISKIEKKEEKTNIENNIKERYIRLKKYTILSNIMLVISIILHFI